MSPAQRLAAALARLPRPARRKHLLDATGLFLRDGDAALLVKAVRG